MDPLISARLAEVKRLCRHHHVRRLELFGSAATGRLTQGSDIDFMVEFDDLPPVNHADAFFELLAGLQRTFGAPVDLVEDRAIRNPYLRASIMASRETVYAVT